MAHADSRVMGALEPRLDAGLRRGGIEAAVRVFVSETLGAGRKTHLAPDCSAPVRPVPRPIRENESRWAAHRVRAVR